MDTSKLQKIVNSVILWFTPWEYGSYRLMLDSKLQTIVSSIHVWFNPWEYGYYRLMDNSALFKARKHRKTGKVQFILWHASPLEHDNDVWHDLDSAYTFIPDTSR